MLHVIKTLDDPMCQLIKDDPVRPEIPIEFRVSEFGEVFVLTDQSGLPTAVVCCAYRGSVPDSVSQLQELPELIPHAAVFYTIWSYEPGAGRQLIRSARTWIEHNRSKITLFVTLSPASDMARVFHLRNGAHVYRVNSDSVNYCYP